MIRREKIYRKVLVKIPNQPDWEGFFHCWAGLSEHPLAIIETFGGSIKEITSEYIQFLEI